MASVVVDAFEEGTGAIALIGFIFLSTVPVSSSEAGASPSFLNVPGSPLDTSPRLADLQAPVPGPPSATVLGNPGRNRLGTLAGAISPGYDSDFYDRIHIYPSLFSLGNVLTDTTVRFKVWNSFFSDKSLVQIDEFGTTTLTISEPTPPGLAPAHYPSLSEYDYAAVVSGTGPAAIVAKYSFLFANATDLKALDFSASETLSGSPGLDWEVGDAWTISLWYKPTSTTDNTIFTIDPPSGTLNSVHFGYEQSTSSYRVTIVDQTNSANVKTRDYPTETPDVNTWVYFTIVKSADGLVETGALRLYRNGELVPWVVIGADDHVDQVATVRTLEMFGSSSISATGQGKIHSWAQWSFALPNSEIAATYNSGEGRTVDLRTAQEGYTSTAFLAHYYRLGDQVSPNLATDLGGVPRDLDVSVGITNNDIITDSPAAANGPGWIEVTPTVDLTGSRVAMFAHVPQRGYSESLMWKTDVIEAWDGREQRVRVRKLPRQKFDIEYLVDEDTERRAMQTILFGNLGKYFGVPLFHFSRNLEADMPIGATSIPVTTADSDFRSSTAGLSEPVVLWRGYDDFEVAVAAVGGVTGSAIALTEPTVKAHDALTTLVIPVQISLLNDGTGWDTYQGGNVQRFRCEWLASGVTDLADLSGLPVHDGTVVFDDHNFMEMGGTLQESLIAKFEVFDSISGKFEALARRLTPEISVTKGFETFNHAESFILRKRLYGLLGRQKAFYLPTFRSDFEVVTSIGAADVNISVAPTGYAQYNGAALEPFGDIMIELNDGTRFFKKITSVTVGVGSPARDELEIDSSLDEPVTIADIKRVSYLYKVRMGSDLVNIKHLDRGVYSVRIPLAGVLQ